METQRHTDVEPLTWQRFRYSNYAQRHSPAFVFDYMRYLELISPLVQTGDRWFVIRRHDDMSNAP